MMRLGNALRRIVGAALVAALLVSVPAQAAVYNLLSAVTTTSTGNVPPIGNGGQIGQPAPATSGLTVSSAQSFLIFVGGAPNGAVSCTVQIVGSNDSAVLTGDTTKWATYGAAVTASGTGTGVTSASGTIPYAYFAAYVTAISGTSAACSVKMNG